MLFSCFREETYHTLILEKDNPVFEMSEILYLRSVCVGCLVAYKTEIIWKMGEISHCVIPQLVFLSTTYCFSHCLNAWPREMGKLPPFDEIF